MENKVKMNRKGITDIFYLLAILFVIVVTVIIGTGIYSEVADKLYETEAISSNTRANSTIAHLEDVSQSYDWITLAALFGFFIVIIVLAITIPANPAFMLLFIGLAILLVLFSVAVSNSYEEFAASSEISGTVTSYYPMTDLIMSNLPIIFTILAVLLMIITYAKVRNEP